ncbi:MAG: hypothetical protein K8S13_12635 [Desulfobacula sp.]|uniref:hypothetical protein n=1 Tax=Desulfobacula sp. TaxID=2593537 RepID=UPI0025C6661D|nr:hypothetical protein [Desulfobacula sp.]MCD4720684.1 hypothetical protein [Desulfobacula sp.]
MNDSVTNNSNSRNRDYENLVDSLRSEANNVKDCFTKFSFHSLAFNGIIFGYIIKVQPTGEAPFISLVGLIISLVCLTVARIGTYKYGTANRHFGYELHLERTRYLFDTSERNKCWIVGWEEAMRAWRIVQASLYNAIYETETFLGIGKDKPKDKDIAYKWYKVSENLKDNTYNKEEGRQIVQYYSGSYLKEMMKILHMIAFLGVIPVIFASIQFYLKGEDFNSYFFMIISLFSFVIIVIRVSNNNRKREILEDGLLSIHSCAIVWQAVIVAHNKAKDEISEIESNGHPYKNYSRVLGEWAGGLCLNIESIHDWVMNPAKEKLVENKKLTSRKSIRP